MRSLIKLINVPNLEMTCCLNTVIMPTLKYGHVATTLNKKEWTELQQPISHEILPKMGFNRHTPHAVVYAAKSVGGLGVPLNKV
jgi:hypothetical protein